MSDTAPFTVGSNMGLYGLTTLRKAVVHEFTQKTANLRPSESSILQRAQCFEIEICDCDLKYNLAQLTLPCWLSIAPASECESHSL